MVQSKSGLVIYHDGILSLNVRWSADRVKSVKTWTGGNN